MPERRPAMRRPGERRGPRCWTILLALLALSSLVHVDPAHGQPDAAPSLVRIPMPDSVALAADLYRPSDPRPAPTVLMRTPYGRRSWGGVMSVYVDAGYNVLLQDVRGTNGSDGRFLPFVNERADGVATLDWIVRQPWSDGRVGVMGASYPGYAGLLVAAAGHPAVEAAVNIGGWAEPQSLLLPGGAQHLMLNLAWTLHSLGRTRESMDWDSVFARVPLSHAIVDDDGEPHSQWRDVLSEYPEFDPALAGAGMGTGVVGAPVLHLAGWNDFTYRGTLEAYRQIEAYGNERARDRQRLVVGPWVHDQQKTTGTRVDGEEYGPAAALGWERMNALALDWFARWMPVDPGRPDVPPNARPDEPQAVLLDTERSVHVFVMGPDRWRAFDRWPPREARTRRWYLRADGSLARHPGGDEAVRRFTYDPNDPLPTVGGVNFHFFRENLGPKDQSPLDDRADVLRYLSEPLASPVTLAGPMEVLLHASTDGPDTDFTASLVVVSPDGVARILEDGIVRLRFRNGLDAPALSRPGEVLEVRIDLGATARTIPAGHRLRVDVSSGSFPKYDRNPNDGTSPMAATEFRPARQAIHHGGRRASYLEVTILEP